MFLFQTLAPTIILIVSLITATSMRGKKIPKNKKKTAKTITTTLITCILLISILGQIHPAKAEIPSQETGTGTTYNATEYVTGVNKTTETYTTKNNFNNLQRTKNFTTTLPQNFNLQGNITINIKNITAQEDSREIVKYNGTYYDVSTNYDWISMSFTVKDEKVNITEVQMAFNSTGPTDPEGSFEIQGADINLKPNGTRLGQFFNFTYASGWMSFQYSTPLSLSKGNYTCVLKDVSQKSNRYYHWRMWNDSESGDNGTVYVYNLGSGLWGGPETTDLPLRLKAIRLNPNNISEPLKYSSANQIDMKVNGLDVGSDNSISFSSVGLFVFTTNLSVIFQKNWTALFVRGGVSVSSSYKVNVTTCFWNLTYSLASVTGGSATNYTERTVNITDVRTNWTPISSTPANTTASRYLTNITVVFSGEGKPLSAHTNLRVTCTSPNYITALDVSPEPVYLGDTITATATVSPAEDGTVSFRLYDKDGNQVDTIMHDSTPSPYSVTFDIPSAAENGTWTVVANYTNNNKDEAGFRSTPFTVYARTSSLSVISAPSSIDYGDDAEVQVRFVNTTDGNTPITNADWIRYNISSTPTWIYCNAPASLENLGNGYYNFTMGGFNFTAASGGKTYNITITAHAAGSGGGGWEASTFTLLTVNKASSSLTLNVNPASITYGESPSITGTLTGKHGEGIGGVQVTLYWNVSTNVISTPTTAAGTGSYSYNTWTPDAGFYNVYASWSGGNENYTEPAVAGPEPLTVGKADSTITCLLSTGAMVYGESVVVDGTVSPAPSVGTDVYIQYSTDNNTWNPLVTRQTNGTGGYSYTWSPGAGTYYFKSYWDGDINYNGDMSDTPYPILTVAKNDSEITVSCSPSTITFSDSTLISGYLTGNSVGLVGETVNLYYNDTPTTYVLIISVITQGSGYYSYDWTPSAGGEYIVKANWTGNANFTGIEETTNLTVNVNPGGITLECIPSVVTYPSGTLIEGNLTDSSGAGLSGKNVQLNYTLAGQSTVITWVITNSTGGFSHSWDAYPRANSLGETYTIRATFFGDIDYGYATNTFIFTVSKASSSMVASLSVYTITFGDTITVYSDLDPDLSSGITTLQYRLVGLVLWNLISSGTPTNGNYSSNFIPPSAGTYEIRATWSGNENYTQTVPDQVVLTVNKKSSTLTVDIDPVSILIKDNTTINVTINPPSILPNPNVTVQYSLDGGIWTNITSQVMSGGTLIYDWYPPFAGSYLIRAIWGGNSNYTGDISDTTGLTVSRITAFTSPEYAQYNCTFDDQIVLRFNFTYGASGLIADDVMINGTSYVFVSDGGGWYNVTYGTSHLPLAGIVYNLEVFIANATYEATTSVFLKVDKLLVVLTLSAPPSVTAGESFTVYANLTYLNGTPIDGARLYFDFRVEYANGTVQWYNATSSNYKVTVEGKANASFQTSEEMDGAEITPFVRFEGNEVANGIVKSPPTGTVKVVIPSSPGGGDGGDGGLGTYLLLLGLFAVLGAFLVVLTQKRKISGEELIEKEKIRRIMVVWESFALYDQTPSEVIAEGHIVDKELVSGFFTAIKYLAEEVAGTTLETMKVYPSHPYYFVYTGNFYCVLILSDKPSPRLERKLLDFASIVEEKYGETVKEQYWEAYASGLLCVPEIRLDLDEEVSKIFGITPYLDEEVMRIFGLAPLTKLHEIVTIFLSQEEIEKLKVRDDVKAVLMTGRDLTDKLGKFPLEKLIQTAADSLGDVRIAHSATIEALEAGLITVVGKPVFPEEED